MVAQSLHAPAVVSSRSIVIIKKRLWICFVVCLVLGIVLRCTNVAHKVYWHDEVFTTIRVLGHQGKTIEQQLIERNLVTAADLQALQQFPTPKRWSDTWSALVGHPEHPPLFYLLERVWVGIFSPSVTAFRALAVVFGLLLLPLTYWLCQQLWRDHWTALIGTSLMALSPIQILYAQEAREYSLWACVILLASGYLLRAMRSSWQYSSDAVIVRSPQVMAARQWGAYTVSLTLLLYTTLLSALVIVAHGLYVLISGSRRDWQRWTMALIGALLMFTPWLIVMLRGSGKLNSATDWTSFRQPLGQLIKFWGLHISSAVVDLGFPLESIYTYLAPSIVLGLLLVALSQLLLVTPPVTMAFSIIMLMVPGLGLILPDLINGGQLSISTRYFMPSLLMVTLIIGGWLRQLILSNRQTYRLWGQIMLAVVLAAGLTSAIISAASFTWWNKNISYHNNTMAAVIKQAENPLVVAELGSTGLGNMISLSYQVPLQTEFLLVKPEQLPDIPPGYSHYFVPYARDQLVDVLTTKTGKAVLPADDSYELWELSP